MLQHHLRRDDDLLGTSRGPGSAGGGRGELLGREATAGVEVRGFGGDWGRRLGLCSTARVGQ